MNRLNTEYLLSLLNAAREELAQGIIRGENPSVVLARHSNSLDKLLRTVWRSIHPERSIGIFATGGYGRRQLYPGSDIDLAVIIEDSHDSKSAEAVEQFVRELWDLGLKVGISTRTLAQSRQAVEEDSTIFTALLESRRLTGPKAMEHELDKILFDPCIWPLGRYLASKLSDRNARYQRFDGSSQRLEPSVKESPGGLRDLLSIQWVGARYLGQRPRGIRLLEQAGLITARERRTLARAERMLSRIRVGLHYLSRRGENRLLFDLQPRLAEWLGYKARPGTLAVESMMQDYYRAAGTIARISAMVFQLLETSHSNHAKELTTDLLLRGGLLDFTSASTVQRNPALILEIFHHWQSNTAVTGLTPNAKRTIAGSLKLINAQFRANPKNRQEFLRLFKSPIRVTEVFFTLHETGILARYLPAFGRIAGRMQYDLYHLFTVDEHVLHVIANLESLRQGRFGLARPDLLEAAKRIDRYDLLFIAALMHDICKGRGGNHSQLGATEARRFSRLHGLSLADTELVVWLVKDHLSLSITAQKRDLSDPEVISEFARQVGGQRRLDYLYVLTAADVCATNPSLWNAWRGSLFSELYESTSQALWRGLENPTNAEAKVAARKRDARELLGGKNSGISRLWRRLGNDYFLQYPTDEIVWHTRNLMAVRKPPAVFLRRVPDGAGTAIMAYCLRSNFAFARVTGALARLGLSIVAARCVPVGTNATLDTYVVLEADGRPIEEERQLQRIAQFLKAELVRPEAEETAPSKAPRQVRMFSTPTRIEITSVPQRGQTLIELHAADHPGLLAAVGRALHRGNVQLRLAKVMTIGERAEDVFHITDSSGNPPPLEALRSLKYALHEEIERTL